jgi:hypothetical protein
MFCVAGSVIQKYFYYLPIFKKEILHFGKYSVSWLFESEGLALKLPTNSEAF